MMEKSHFLGSKQQKKAGACWRFPLRYYKDNTSAGKMQIAFNFLLQMVGGILRFQLERRGEWLCFFLDLYARSFEPLREKTEGNIFL